MIITKIKMNKAKLNKIRSQILKIVEMKIRNDVISWEKELRNALI